jgi:ribosomal protein L37AE/L43A
MGDRECPVCGEDTLVEANLTKWKCLKCKEVFDVAYLDDAEEEEE